MWREITEHLPLNWKIQSPSRKDNASGPVVWDVKCPRVIYDEPICAQQTFMYYERGGWVSLLSTPFQPWWKEIPSSLQKCLVIEIWGPQKWKPLEFLVVRLVSSMPREISIVLISFLGRALCVVKPKGVYWCLLMKTPDGAFSSFLCHGPFCFQAKVNAHTPVSP